MTLEEVLHAYEDKGKFSILDISTDLSKLDEKERSRMETKAELLAMSFSDNSGKDCWGTYYGPVTTWENKNTHQIVYRPDKSDISLLDIDYWSKRAIQTSSPILRMRYSGLVWDFGKYITGEEPNFIKIKKTHIESCIDILYKDYAEHPVVGVTIIRHALKKAFSISNKELVHKAYNTLIQYTKKYSTDEAPGIWGESMVQLTNHLNCFADYEEAVVGSHEQRFDRLNRACEENYKSTDKFLHSLRDECELLCDYYFKKKDLDNVNCHLDLLLEKIRLFYELRGSLWSHGMLQMMQSLYRKYNLNKKANKLFLDIQILGKDVLREMSGQQFTVPLEKEVLDKYFSYYISGSTEEVLDKYIEQYIPNLAKEKKYQERGDQLTPLLSMIRTVAYDWTGIPINNIGVGPNAEKQKLTYGMYTRMLISSGVIEMHIQKMKEKEIYTFEQVYSVIEKIPFINKEQLPIVRRGLEAYFNKDYISACTILVTQFEAAIRILAANAGHEIMRTNNMPEEGNEYASLEKLLFDFLPTDKDQSPDKERIQDIITYFQTLFTDKFGWNLRNLICHGLLPASSFNNVMADRIVHAFLTLKMIRLEKAESKV